MSSQIRRINQDNGYTMLPNKMLQDKNLSAIAKAILCYLLSCPPDWNIYKTFLHKNFKGLGREASAKAFKELEENKYIIRVGYTGNRNYDYVVSPTPVLEVGEQFTLTYGFPYAGIKQIGHTDSRIPKSVCIQRTESNKGHKDTPSGVSIKKASLSKERKPSASVPSSSKKSDTVKLSEEQSLLKIDIYDAVGISNLNKKAPSYVNNFVTSLSDEEAKSQQNNLIHYLKYKQRAQEKVHSKYEDLIAALKEYDWVKKFKTLDNMKSGNAISKALSSTRTVDDKDKNHYQKVMQEKLNSKK